MRGHFCARRWLRTRRPRLTPSPCSRTGSDALVGILVGDKEEPSSKRGHGDACASAGGVRTATLASRPLREGRAPAVRVRRPAFGTGQTSSVLTSYILGPEVHASVTCVGFNNDPHSLICRKATRLVSPWHAEHVNCEPGPGHGPVESCRRDSSSSSCDRGPDHARRSRAHARPSRGTRRRAARRRRRGPGRDGGPDREAPGRPHSAHTHVTVTPRTVERRSGRIGRRRFVNWFVSVSARARSSTLLPVQFGLQYRS